MDYQFTKKFAVELVRSMQAKIYTYLKLVLVHTRNYIHYTFLYFLKHAFILYFLYAKRKKKRDEILTKKVQINTKQLADR